MKRRKFLLTSGAAILGSKATQSLNQNPAVALNFDLVGVEDVQPSNTDTILVDFENFELIPKYVDETAGEVTIKITLDIDGYNAVTSETKLPLTNGQIIRKNDLGSAIPIVQDGINSSRTTLDGSIKIDISHPEVSDTYKQLFTITDDSLQQGLTGWWPLHEWNGRANDLTINQNHGVVNGATQASYGVGGLTGYSLDGTDDTVDIQNTGSVDFVNETKTICFWANPTGPDANTVVSKHPGTHPVEFRLTHRDEYKLRVTDSSGTGSTIRDDQARFDTWSHVACVIDRPNNTIELFVNGQSVGQGDTSALADDTSNANILIGDILTGGTTPYKGNIADFRLYDRRLDQSEIDSLYNRGNGDYTEQSLHDGTDSEAVSRWGFNNSIDDLWGLNNASASTVNYQKGIRKKTFDAANSDELTVSDNSSLDITDEITVAAWIKSNKLPENMSRSYPMIWRKPNGGDNGSITFGYLVSDTNTFGIRVSSGDTGGNPDIKKTIKPTEWTHMVGTYNQNELKLYKNGVQIGTTETTIPINTNSKNGYIGSGWEGLIDDLRIYSRELNERGINDLYQWGTRGQDLRERTTTKNKNNLVGWWKLSETNGSTAYDSSGNGNNGSINGATQNSTTDPVGNPAYEFDGDKDYIQVSNTGASSPVSVTAWMYPRTAGEHDYGRIFDQYDDFDLALGDGNSSTILWEINGNNYWFGSNTLDKNQWYHLVATVDSSGAGKVYINGVLLEEKQLETVSSSNNRGYIGSMQSTEGYLRWFDGYISDVRIYDREITPQEISYLYEQKF